MKLIPELSNIGLARSKLQTFCSSLLPIYLTKGSSLFKEGDISTSVYFVRHGEIEISKLVAIPRQTTELDDVSKLLQDPK